MSMMRTSEYPILAPREAVPIERAAVRAVAYADVFDYPLQAAEVHRYLHGIAATLEATEAALVRCRTSGTGLAYRDGFYTLPGREGLVDTRRRCAARAQALWPAAVSYGRLMSGLPFVRMVAVTGSLAWNNVDDLADIDYLVVTEPGRLWLCRWMIQALRRAALLDGVPLCPNYVLSTRALALPDRSLYAAYELARMTPLAGMAMYRRMRRANPWTTEYLPNAAESPRPPGGESRPTLRWRKPVLARLARLVEKTLRLPLGAALERGEMTYRRWKMSKHADAGREVTYSIDCCKSHAGHRQRILTALAERLRNLGECAT
jgi:hypothetical protein